MAARSRLLLIVAALVIVVGAVTANLFHVLGQGPAGRVRPSVANWQQVYPGRH